MNADSWLLRIPKLLVFSCFQRMSVSFGSAGTQSNCSCAAFWVDTSRCDAQLRSESPQAPFHVGLGSDRSR